ncbi:MAG: hypothetical protein P8Z76_09330 [Alphaproteobacteria bacterium]
MISGRLRSLLLAMLGGMMAASLLHVRKIVDLSFGFAPGSFGEGAAIAIVGAAAGVAVLTVFRMLSVMLGSGGNEKEEK